MTFEKVCPTIEELVKDGETDIPCTQKGCGKIFRHSSALHFHLVKVHQILQNESSVCLQRRQKKSVIHYHCPVSGCVYDSKQSRHFTAFKNLKQHYMVVHAEKKFRCETCEMGFSLEVYLKRHVKNCRVVFNCQECGKNYKNLTGLQWHCKKSGHPFKFKKPTNSEVEVAQATASQGDENTAAQAKNTQETSTQSKKTGSQQDTRASSEMISNSDISVNQQEVANKKLDPSAADCLPSPEETSSQVLGTECAACLQENGENNSLSDGSTDNNTIGSHQETRVTDQPSDSSSPVSMNTACQTSIDDTRQGVGLTDQQNDSSPPSVMSIGCQTRTNDSRQGTEMMDEHGVCFPARMMSTACQASMDDSQHGAGVRDQHDHPSLGATNISCQTENVCTAEEINLHAASGISDSAVESTSSSAVNIQKKPGIKSSKPLLPILPSNFKQPIIVVPPNAGPITIINNCNFFTNASSSVNLSSARESPRKRRRRMAPSASKKSSKNDIGANFEYMNPGTSGENILHAAMQTVNIPIMKESRGSQVSPVTKSRRNCHAQTTLPQFQSRSTFSYPWRQNNPQTQSTFCQTASGVTAEFGTNTSVECMFSSNSNSDGLVFPVMTSGMSSSSTMNQNVSTNIIPAPQVGHMQNCLQQSASSDIIPASHASCALISTPPTFNHSVSTNTIAPPDANMRDCMHQAANTDFFMNEMLSDSLLQSNMASSSSTATMGIQFPDFLSTEVQTLDFNPVQTNIQTQTNMTDFIDDLWNNIETQTYDDDFWQNLTDIETQTNLTAFTSENAVETQTNVTSLMRENAANAETQTAQCGAAAYTQTQNTEHADVQTQLGWSNFDPTQNSLMDYFNYPPNSFNNM